MNDMKKNSLLKLIRANDPLTVVFDFLNYLRSIYLRQYIPVYIEKLCKMLGIEILKVRLEKKQRIIS